MIQACQGLGEREAPLADGDSPAEDHAGDLIRRLRAVFQDGAHDVEAFGVVGGYLVDAPVEIVEDGAMAGEDEVSAEAAQHVQRPLVADERVRLRLGPEPY